MKYLIQNPFEHKNTDSDFNALPSFELSSDLLHLFNFVLDTMVNT